jgi:hypothetical protein
VFAVFKGDKRYIQIEWGRRQELVTWNDYFVAFAIQSHSEADFDFACAGGDLQPGNHAEPMETAVVTFELFDEVRLFLIEILVRE